MIEILTTYSHTLMVDQYKKKHKNQLSPSYKRKTEGQVLKKFSVWQFRNHLQSHKGIQFRKGARSTYTTKRIKADDHRQYRSIDEAFAF